MFLNLSKSYLGSLVSNISYSLLLDFVVVSIFRKNYPINLAISYFLLVLKLEEMENNNLEIKIIKSGIQKEWETETRESTTATARAQTLPEILMVDLMKILPKVANFLDLDFGIPS